MNHDSVPVRGIRERPLPSQRTCVLGGVQRAKKLELERQQGGLECLHPCTLRHLHVVYLPDLTALPHAVLIRSKAWENLPDHAAATSDVHAERPFRNKHSQVCLMDALLFDSLGLSRHVYGSFQFQAKRWHCLLDGGKPCRRSNRSSSNLEENIPSLDPCSLRRHASYNSHHLGWRPRSRGHMHSEGRLYYCDRVVSEVFLRLFHILVHVFSSEMFGMDSLVGGIEKAFVCIQPCAVLFVEERIVLVHRDTLIKGECARRLCLLPEIKPICCVHGHVVHCCEYKATFDASPLSRVPGQHLNDARHDIDLDVHAKRLGNHQHPMVMRITVQWSLAFKRSRRTMQGHVEWRLSSLKCL
mmetsp:Transcript_142186/g.247824  ORF Transcript_142186/g.247824 Transcript_142186/m.247824 type:complete len:356 (-) Transcript_142186:421-1488(-)